MNDIRYLYHYYEKNQPQFRTLTSLPFDEAKAIMCGGLLDKSMFNDLKYTWVDNFLNMRYEKRYNTSGKIYCNRR